MSHERPPLPAETITALPLTHTLSTLATEVLTNRVLVDRLERRKTPVTHTGEWSVMEEFL